MLISVNGTIIDTKQIHSITPIEKGCLYKNRNNEINYMEIHYFAIHFFNNTNSNYLGIKSPFIDYRIKPQNTLELEKEYEQNFIKISKFRESIIKIWQENQSEIPQFNL